MLRAAIALADEGGIESLSMRKLGQELGVEAMSLYNHVANKDDLLDGIVDAVTSEIDVPPAESRLEGRRSAGPRSRPTRSFVRHRWACSLMMRRPGPMPRGCTGWSRSSERFGKPASRPT